MAAKRIRCICGKVYSPDESKVCPSCGTEVRIESISIVAPVSAESPPAAAASSTAAMETAGIARQNGPRSIPWIRIGVGVWLAAGIAAVAMYFFKPDSKTVPVADVKMREAPARKDDKGSPAGNSVSLEPSVAKPNTTEKKESPAPKGGDPVLVKKEETPHPASAGKEGGAGKSGQQWVVQAKETEAASGAALIEALEKAAEGDTILLKPGTYAGEFTVGDGIRLVGESGGAGLPVIKMGSKRILIEVNQPGATLENLKIVFASEGSTPGLKVNPGAKLAIAGCEVQATGGNCVMGLPTSSVTATKSVFTSQGSVAVMLVEAAGQFTGCSFSNSRIGLAVAGDGRVELNDCIFEKCGPKSGPQNGARAEEGYIAKADGSSKAGVSFTDCRFAGNTGGILVTQGMSAALTKCVFSGNGFPENSPLFTQGLFAVSAGGRAVLTGVTFQGDRQGLGVYSDGSLEMTDCHLTGVGLKGSRTDISYTGSSVFARGKGAVVRLKQCEIADAPGEVAALASDGGAIEAEACEIRNADFFAVYAGTGRNEAPCHVVVKGGRIVNNRAGLKIATGGSGSVDGTEFRQNGIGIEIADAGTSATVRKAVLAENRGMGLLTVSRADVSLTDCSIENNAGGGVQVGVVGKPESRADLTLENCRIGSNVEFDVKAGAQSRLTVKNCTWTTPGGRPKLAIEQQTFTQFEPTLDGLAGGVVMPVKKTKQTASNDTPARPAPQRSTPSRTPPPNQDPVGQAIDAINKLRRIIR